MAKTRKEKEAMLERLTGALSKSAHSVMLHFKGLSVADESSMRNALREAGISYVVAKKTLLKKAITANGFESSPELGGEVALAYALEAKDPTAPARMVYEFAKKFGAERIALLGGVFESVLHGKDGITEIATIPAVPVLRGMFVNVINSPIQGLVIALDGIAQKKS